LIHNPCTGEDSPACIDPDMRDLFLDAGIFNKLTHPCPFFRHLRGSGNACCTAGLTQPEICCDYCYRRLLIIDHQGRSVGKIRYVRLLCSEDTILAKTWDVCIEQPRTG